MMTIKELKKWLIEEIADATVESEMSWKVAANSYGAGYDSGFRDGLERVRLKLEDKIDT